MGRVLQYLTIGFVVSLFYFPFEFTFLPSGINTKMMLALLGILLAVYHAIQNGAVRISRQLLGAIGFVVLFSLICFFAVDYNNESDYSYATYFISFGVWIFSAYAVCSLIRMVHGEVNVTLVTYYLAGVCFSQCVLAMLIDLFPVFKMLVNRYIEQEQNFLMEVNRLYGIGASLDNAGARLSLVLIMMAAVLSKVDAVKGSRWKILMMLIAFFTIGIVGNMMSRTTSVGAGLALFYIMWNTGVLRVVIKSEFFKFHLIFLFMLVIAVVVTTYFYQNDKAINVQIRFAFEGFFNWVEKGVWRTASTDKLNNSMWVWPTDLKTWVIGTGKFDNWVFGTDIGYCRFILYCGLTGFVTFALFFVYNAVVFAHEYRQYRDMFFFFLILTFVLWVKVSTDIFLIYALLYCIDMFNRKDILTSSR